MKIYEIVSEAGFLNAAKAGWQAFRAARSGASAAPAAGQAASTAAPSAGQAASTAAQAGPAAERVAGSVVKEKAKDLLSWVNRSVYRRKFGDVYVKNHLVRVAGTYIYVLQTFNIYEFAQEYWKNQLIINADRDKGDLSDAMWRQFSRENLELLGLNIATSLGFGKLLRTITNVPILKQVKELGFAIPGMFFGKNGGQALQVLASEAVALKVAKWLQTEEGQSAARSAVQHAIDPSLTFLVGLGPKVMTDFVLGTAEEQQREQERTQRQNKPDAGKQNDVGSVSQSGQAADRAPRTSNDPTNPASRNVEIDFDKIADKLNWLR